LRRIRVTPATLIALLALTLALSGGAYAVTGGGAATVTACVHKHGGGLYLSHRCTRGDKSLRWNVTGAAGAQGPAGPQGQAGEAGATGSQGPTGPFPLTLASGKSLTGAYGVSGAATAVKQLVGTAISFDIPLLAAPTANFVAMGGKASAACPGSVTNPLAAPSDLCIYEASRENLELVGWEDPVTHVAGEGIEPFGFEVSGLSKAAGQYGDFGSWAVTAP
jgi:hypothetical protein